MIICMVFSMKHKKKQIESEDGSKVNVKKKNKSTLICNTFYYTVN